MRCFVAAFGGDIALSCNRSQVLSSSQWRYPLLDSKRETLLKQCGAGLHCLSNVVCVVVLSLCDEDVVEITVPRTKLNLK